MNTLKTVENALSLLTYLVHFDGAVGVRDLAARLGMPRSTVHRLLVTLEKHDYIEQDPVTRKYQLGCELSRLVAMGVSHERLRTVVRPHLLDLAGRGGSTTHFAVRVGWACVYIDKVVGASEEQMASEVGWRKPLYCTGVGKALLAFAPDEFRASYVAGVETEAYTPNTLRSREGLAAELAEIRRSGMAYDRQEIEQGLYCMAVPVLDGGARLIGSLSVSSRSQGEQFLDDRTVQRLLQQAANAIGESFTVASGNMEWEPATSTAAKAADRVG